MIHLIAAASVHTTGVNLEGVLAILSPLMVMLGAFATFIVRSVKRSIVDTVTDIIAREVTPVLNQIKDELRAHDTRIARLEGVEEGRRMAVAAAGVSTTSSARETKST